MNLNVVNLVGRAGSDAEARWFESGAVKCTVNIAVNRPTSRDDQPDWFSLEMWDKTAKVAADWVKKGSLIGIQGSLRIETWTDRNTGAPRSKPVIRVSRLDLLGSKRDNAAAAQNNYSDGEF